MKSSEWRGYNLITVRMHMCKRTIQISDAGMRDLGFKFFLSSLCTRVPQCGGNNHFLLV